MHHYDTFHPVSYFGWVTATLALMALALLVLLWIQQVLRDAYRRYTGYGLPARKALADALAYGAYGVWKGVERDRYSVTSVAPAQRVPSSPATASGPACITRPAPRTRQAA